MRRRAGILQAVSRSVGRSYTPPGTALAWCGRHDSGLSSAASLSFLLTDRIVDEKTEWSLRETAAQRPKNDCSFPSVYSPTGTLFSQKVWHIVEPYFPAVSLNHLIIWFQWLHSGGTQIEHAVCVKATVNTAMKTVILHPTHESAALETPLWLHCWKLETVQQSILIIWLRNFL